MLNGELGAVGRDTAELVDEAEGDEGEAGCCCPASFQSVLPGLDLVALVVASPAGSGRW